MRNMYNNTDTDHTFINASLEHTVCTRIEVNTMKIVVKLYQPICIGTCIVHCQYKSSTTICGNILCHVCCACDTVTWEMLVISHTATSTILLKYYSILVNT